MARYSSIYALCDNCGLYFDTGIALGGGARAVMEGNYSQCPRCGHMSRIPDGLYEIVSDAIGAIRTSQATPSDLRELRNFLVHVSADDDPDAVSASIENQIPNLRSLSFLFRNRQNRQEFYEVVRIVLAIITVLITMHATSELDFRDIDVDAVDVDVVVEQMEEDNP